MSLALDFRRKAATLWHLQRVKRLVREMGDLGPQTLISVTEMPCKDLACMGPVTQITVLGLNLTRRVWVIHRPAAKVTAADLHMIGT